MNIRLSLITATFLVSTSLMSANAPYIPHISNRDSARTQYWAKGVDETKGWSDGLQFPNHCWGAVTANMMSWWQKQVGDGVSVPTQAPQEAADIRQWVWDNFKDFQNGRMPNKGINDFFKAFYPEIEANRDPYYWMDHGTPLWNYRPYHNADLITKSLLENFESGNVVAAITSQYHTVTLWGIEVDDQGKITKGWITDSDPTQGNTSMLEEALAVYDANGYLSFQSSHYDYATGGTRTDMYEIDTITYLSIDKSRIQNSLKKQDYSQTSTSQTSTPTQEQNASISTDTVASQQATATTTQSSSTITQSAGSNPITNTQYPSRDSASSTSIASQSSNTSTARENIQQALSDNKNLTMLEFDLLGKTMFGIKQGEHLIALIDPSNKNIFALVSNLGLSSYSFEGDVLGSDFRIIENTNPKAIKEAQELADMGLNFTMVEVNNLNKRMGELRNIKGAAGVWARIMNGAGSSKGGYKSTYTHIQGGFDKQTSFYGGELFTGLTFTYTTTNITQSNSQNTAFSNGKTDSLGGGLYAIALLNSGFYIDVIGKYVAHDNNYNYDLKEMNLFLAKQKYNTHSLYFGAELGQRIAMPFMSFIEPQIELVYITTSGSALRDNNSNSVKLNDSQMLVARAGANLGKNFNIGSWEFLALLGLNYQGDLHKDNAIIVNGKTATNNKKDHRMLMSIGLNAKAGEHLSFALSFERSAFGNYNVNRLINANIRYSF